MCSLRVEKELPLGRRRTRRRWWTADSTGKDSGNVRDHQHSSAHMSAFSNAVHLEGGGGLGGGGLGGGWLQAAGIRLLQFTITIGSSERREVKAGDISE